MEYVTEFWPTVIWVAGVIGAMYVVYRIVKKNKGV